MKTHDVQITKLEQSVSAHATMLETADNYVHGLESRISALESSSTITGAVMSSVAAISVKVDQLVTQQVSASDINQQIQQLGQSVASLQSGSGSTSINRTEKTEKRGIMESKAIGFLRAFDGKKSS